MTGGRIDGGEAGGNPLHLVTETTLLTFLVGSRNLLLREYPSVARQVRRAAAHRLNAQRP